MKVHIGSDHGGFYLKKQIITLLKELKIEFVEYGCYSTNSVDYGPIAMEVAEEVAGEENSRGILICGTGIGMSIMANKVKGVRAALVHDVFSAEATREHNNSNILCMGERVIGKGLAVEIVKKWLNTPFHGGRHRKRIDFIRNYEETGGADNDRENE